MGCAIHSTETVPPSWRVRQLVRADTSGARQLAQLRILGRARRRAAPLPLSSSQWRSSTCQGPPATASMTVAIAANLPSARQSARNAIASVIPGELQPLQEHVDDTVTPQSKFPDDLVLRSCVVDPHGRLPILRQPLGLSAEVPIQTAAADRSTSRSPPGSRSIRAAGRRYAEPSTWTTAARTAPCPATAPAQAARTASSSFITVNHPRLRRYPPPPPWLRAPGKKGSVRTRCPVSRA